MSSMTAESMAKANKDHFDKTAKDYDAKEWQKKMIAYTIEYLRSQIDFIGIDQASKRPLRMLDYACGPGTITEALASYMSECRGLDVSQAMVERYNAAAETGKFGQIKCQASVGNLLVPSSEADELLLDSPELRDFDLAVVGWGFHHFHDPVQSIVKLAERLRSGGVVLIVDFADDKFTDAGPVKGAIHTHGFSEATMKRVFEQAGLGDVGYQLMPDELQLELSQGIIRRQGFLGRARKGMNGNDTGQSKILHLFPPLNFTVDIQQRTADMEMNKPHAGCMLFRKSAVQTAWENYRNKKPVTVKKLDLRKARSAGPSANSEELTPDPYSPVYCDYPRCVPSRDWPRIHFENRMNHLQFRPGMQVHNVPEDERYVDSSGRTMPWGYAYPDPSQNKKVPLERGPFGRNASRRTQSRSKTATPSTKEDLLRLENQRFQDDIFNRFKAEQAEAQLALVLGPQRDNAPSHSHRPNQDLSQSAGFVLPKKDTSAATFSEPTEILIHGYLPSHLPTALTFYESASLGTIYEDYERAPAPNQNPRYASGLVNMRDARKPNPRRNLTPEAMMKIKTFRGGKHWIKVTLDSPLSAQRAMSASPHLIGGCQVHASPWTGAGPAEDIAFTFGAGGVAGTLAARSGMPSRQTNALRQGDRPFSSFPTRLNSATSKPSGGLTDSTSSTEGANSSSDATVRGETVDTAMAQLDSAQDNTLRQRTSHAQDMTQQRRVPRVRSARILKLRPAEEALLPVTPWSVRTFGWIPLLGLLLGAPSSNAAPQPEATGNGFVGSTVPKTETGEFDWARASFWWIMCFYIDLCIGTDMCGLKSED